MLIPISYALNDNASAPDDTVERECKYCHTRFAIPTDEVDKYKDNVCEGCKVEFDKDMAAASAALLKPATDVADTISKALGK